MDMNCISRAISFIVLFALSSVFAKQGMNLVMLTAKDTASFETYSKRIDLVQDSITAMQAEIENVKQNTAASMPLAPKGEREKPINFNARKAKWEKELNKKVQRNTKAITNRIVELENAKKKIERNRASLYCFVEIKSNPAAASVSINRTEMGATPLKYENFLPGYMAIRIYKEGYQPWDTTITIQAGQKLNLNVTLTEGNHFRQKDELDLSQILAKEETESQLIIEAPSNAMMALGAYNADKEFFEVEVFDTLDNKSPFYFVGKVGIPLDTAKIMNRSLDGFLVSIGYLNYPFVFEDSSFYLAMKELILSRHEVPLKVDGVFKPISRFETKKGYGAWRAHADSILNSMPKRPQSFDDDYALSSKEKAPSGGGLGWRGWTRILTFAGAATCGTFAVMKHLNVKKHKDRFNDISETQPSGSWDEYTNWYIDNYEPLWRQKNAVRKNQDYRTIFGSAAGGLVLIGALTFVF